MTRRRAIWPLLLAALMTMAVVGTALAAPPNVRTGERINVLLRAFDPQPGDERFDADTAFHVAHGWCGLPGTTGNPPGQFGFAFYIDGAEVPLRLDATRTPGCSWSRSFVANFPDGLPAGTYEFHGVWSQLGVPYQEATFTLDFD